MVIRIIKGFSTLPKVLVWKMAGYLVSIRKVPFSALAVSIFGFSCAAYLCTPPRKLLIS